MGRLAHLINIPVVCILWSIVPCYAQNQPPIATNDTDTINEDQIRFIDVQDNDWDPDGDPLTTTYHIGPQNGTYQLLGDDSIRYIPFQNFNGVDSFFYIIFDGKGGEDTAKVTIKVFPVNDEPVPANDTVYVAEDKPAIIDVQNNDFDVDGDMMITNIITPSQHGSEYPIFGDSINYTPDTDFFGLDSLEYFVCDNGSPALCSGNSKVYINVVAINDTPRARADTAYLLEDETSAIAILENDDDRDQDPLTIRIINGPYKGVGSINNDSIFYQPAPDSNLIDIIVYEICDTGAPVLCDSSFILLNILPLEDPPRATNDTVFVYEDSLSIFALGKNDVEPDGDSVTIDLLSLATQGQVNVLGPDSFSYDPDPDYHGMDTMAYTLCDSGGLCDTGYVMIIVIPVNDKPIALDDSIFMVAGTDSVIHVQANDHDIDHDPLTTSILTYAGPDSFAVLPDQSIWVHTSDGSDSLQQLPYTICDPGGLCDTATLFIHLSFVPNQPPIAVNDTVILAFNETVHINILTNDFDPDGDVLIPGMVQTPENGMAMLTDQQQLKYRPNDGYHGPDRILYQVCDEGALCDTAEVFLEVEPQLPELFIPSGFSPNNDQFNDRFVIVYPTPVSGTQLTVYNEWGIMVYIQKDYQNDWDGTNLYGNTLPDGTYYYVLKLSNGSSYAGHVSIHR